jgi:DNA-directed RNA polymerase specialized sigma24 family protein
MLLTYDDAAFEELPDSQPEVDEGLLANERAVDVQRALEHLPGRWQSLMRMLMADPPISYAEISQTLELPVGSIGPMRGRCLEKLRVVLEGAA